MINPFFEPSPAPFGAPPFDRIKPEHFRPAYERALKAHEAEIAAIADNPEAPSFANTIAALENSGRLLSRIGHVFHNLASSDTSEALMVIEREMAPRLAQHANAITLNAALFARIDALYAARDALGLDSEEIRVLERYHLDFVRAGARLGEDDKKRYAALTERLATLGTGFAQNVLADEQDTVLPLAEADLEGLPDFARAAAAETAKERRLAAPYAATTTRSSVEPILQFAARREVREKLFKAWVSRGDNANAHDNNSLIEEIVSLRVEEAQLLGYKSYADYKLADTMAKTPETARAMRKRFSSIPLSPARSSRSSLPDKTSSVDRKLSRIVTFVVRIATRTPTPSAMPRTVRRKRRRSRPRWRSAMTRRRVSTVSSGCGRRGARARRPPSLRPPRCAWP